MRELLMREHRAPRALLLAVVFLTPGAAFWSSCSAFVNPEDYEDARTGVDAGMNVDAGIVARMDAGMTVCDTRPMLEPETEVVCFGSRWRVSVCPRDTFDCNGDEADGCEQATTWTNHSPWIEFANSEGNFDSPELAVDDRLETCSRFPLSNLNRHAVLRFSFDGGASYTEGIAEISPFVDQMVVHNLLQLSSEADVTGITGNQLRDPSFRINISNDDYSASQDFSIRSDLSMEGIDGSRIVGFDLEFRGSVESSVICLAEIQMKIHSAVCLPR